MRFNIFSFLSKSIDFGSRSGKWRNVRAEHLKKEPECQACGRASNLEVHHIIPVHVNPDLELDESNLITLDHDCHLLFGHLMNWKSYNKDVINDCRGIKEKIKNRP